MPVISQFYGIIIQMFFNENGKHKNNTNGGIYMYIVPDPIEVKTIEDYRLWIKFKNGKEKIFDMKKYIGQKFYNKLKDKKYFEKVKVVENTIQWENGEDIAPENLYYDSTKIKE